MYRVSFQCICLLLLLPFAYQDDDNTMSTVSTTVVERIDFANLETLITCKFQPNGYDCDGSGKKIPKYYYDLKLEDCKTSNIGTCSQNLNAYETLSNCHRTCQVPNLPDKHRLSSANINTSIDLIKKIFIFAFVLLLSTTDAGLQTITQNLSAAVFCRLQPDFGQCNDYHPRWYFDMTTRRCKGFSFSGCGGNLNRFKSQQSCNSACSYTMKLSSQ